MTIIILKYKVLAMLAISWLCASMSIAAQVTAPTGDSAYLPYGSCQSTHIPDFPNTWSANVLLTPFQAQGLKVARVSMQHYKYKDIKESKMVITLDTLPNTGPLGWYIQGENIYTLSTSTGGNLQCRLTTTQSTTWKAPASDLLAHADCSCQGSSVVTGQESEAWRCPSAQYTTENHEYDWFWFTKDANNYPIRILNSQQSNTHNLPIIGETALANFTDVTTTPDPLLKTASDLCNSTLVGKVAISDTGDTGIVSPTIVGLTYAHKNSQPSPPLWPNTAFANGALFSVGGQRTSMAIYYDWSTLQEVSKIKDSDGFVQDTRLTKGITYEVNDESYGHICTGTLVNVGIWSPDWASNDECQYFGTIDENTPLNPLNNKLQVLSCYFGTGNGITSEIQAWYTYENRPVMFYETNAGDLDLIDYSEWIPKAKIPEGVLYKIDSCPGASEPPVVFNECNACHGANKF